MLYVLCYVRLEGSSRWFRSFHGSKILDTSRTWENSLIDDHAVYASIRYWTSNIFHLLKKTKIHNTTNSIKCQLKLHSQHSNYRGGKKLENNHNDCDDNYKYNITP